VIAISATELQGVYASAKIYQMYAPLRDATPMAVLGGSIYLYEFPGGDDALTP
jgi:hypothetical protein